MSTKMGVAQKGLAGTTAFIYSDHKFVLKYHTRHRKIASNTLGQWKAYTANNVQVTKLGNIIDKFRKYDENMGKIRC